MIKRLLQLLLISTLVLGSTGLFAQKHAVKVTEFTLNARDQKVIIEWKTDANTPANYFAIQKSIDGVNYKTVALVLGPDPKQKDCDCYGGFDKYVSKTAKPAYYRLVHVDTEGNEQITGTKSLTTP